MKRKKDRSGKVALIASLIIILLVGVCVFSLYSIKEPGFLNGLGLFLGRVAGTETGKLLTREDDAQGAENDGLVVTGTVDETEGYSAPVVWDTGEGQAVVVLGQQPTPEEEQRVIEEQKETTQEEKKEATQDDQKVVIQQEQKETTSEEAASQEQKEEAPVEEMKTVVADAAQGVQDVSGTALNATEDRAPVVLSVQDSITDTYDVQESALMAVDDAYDDTYEAPVHQVVKDTDADVTGGDDGWRFDYETEEWYQVDLASQRALAQPAAVQPIANFSTALEETGEWRFDEETEEWYYAEFADGEAADGNTDGNDDDPSDDGSDDDDSDNDVQKETGEWKFNEDTGEWYYVLSQSEKRSTNAGDKKVTVTGEWLFDEETGEWYYAESTGAAGGDEEEEADQDEDEPDAGSTGAWLYNEETGEWYYDENATVGEDGEDEDTDTEDENTDDEDTEDTDDSEDEADEDDEETVDGEWIYDEETHEWIYVEGTEKKEDKDDKEDTEEEETTKAKESVEEVVEELSLGEEIVNYAMGYVGVTPYVGAGRSLTSGTDCSGFVNLIFDQYGIYCSPASMSYDGGEFGTVIGLDELQPGDIVVYGGGSHVAIYAGDGYVVHCSSPQNGTVYWKMDYRSDASWGLRVLE